MAFCMKCGAALPEGARFCISCGTPASQPPPAAPIPEPVSEPVAENVPIPVAEPNDEHISEPATELIDEAESREAEASAPESEEPSPVVPSAVVIKPLKMPDFVPPPAPLSSAGDSEDVEDEKPAPAPTESEPKEPSPLVGNEPKEPSPLDAPPPPPYPPVGQYQAPMYEPMPQKKNKALPFIIAGGALIVVVLVVLLFMLGGGGQKNSPYAGEWECIGYESMGVSLTVESLGESSMELKESGRIEVEFLGVDGAGKWEETPTGILITSAGDELTCTLQGTTLVLEYANVKMFFAREGGFAGTPGPEPIPETTPAPEITPAPEATPAPDSGLPLPSSEPSGSLTAAQEQWNGEWYGVMYITGTSGDNWEGYEDYSCDFYGAIELDEDGYGYFDGSDEPVEYFSSNGVMMSMWIEADAEHFDQVGDEAWFIDMDIIDGENDESFYVTPADGNRDMFTISGQYIDPEGDGGDGFDFVLVFVRDGCEWDTDVSPVTPPGYDSYLDGVKSGSSL